MAYVPARGFGGDHPRGWIATREFGVCLRWTDNVRRQEEEDS
jgi:hypothetical protein